MRKGERITWLDSGVRRLEQTPDLDLVARSLDSITGPLESGPIGGWLRGDWLGHALHPLLTDFPLGCWIGAGLLDLFGSDEMREASRRLVGFGVLATPLTIAAGLAEWVLLESSSSRRVATVHAVGNTLAGLAYLTSWNRRRGGRHGSGVAWGLVGGVTAVATGYLGGHLSLVMRAGTGSRGRRPLALGGWTPKVRRIRATPVRGAA